MFTSQKTVNGWSQFRLKVDIGGENKIMEDWKEVLIDWVKRV